MPDPAIEFRAVSFARPDRPRVLDAFSLTVNNWDTVTRRPIYFGRMPGDPVPLYLYPPHWDASGLAAEAAVLTLMFFVFP